jgi:hypothetical protein
MHLSILVTNDIFDGMGANNKILSWTRRQKLIQGNIVRLIDEEVRGENSYS